MSQDKGGGVSPRIVPRPTRPSPSVIRAATLPASAQAPRAAVKAAQDAVAQSRDRLSRHATATRPQKKTISPRCVDCGAAIRRLDERTLLGWWVVNLGALVCNQCASCHRSLGRHVSTVQRVPDAAIATVVQVLSTQVNTVWEARLPAKIKPFPTSPVNDKQEYIVSKYVQRLYLKPPPIAGMKHLEAQLRTAVLQNDIVGAYHTLCFGAHDFETEPAGTGLTCLHVAASMGHADMVELLLLHGANPAVEADGMLPETLAAKRGFLDIASRLRASRNIIFTAFHDFTSDMPGSSNGDPDTDPPLRSLEKEQLEALVVDMYDEVCRRSDEEAWQAATSPEIRKETIPVLFLPIADNLSQDRLQSRQKLATLGQRQFAQLIRDLLAEMDHRRFAGASVARPRSRRPSVPCTDTDLPTIVEGDGDGVDDGDAGDGNDDVDVNTISSSPAVNVHVHVDTHRDADDGTAVEDGTAATLCTTTDLGKASTAAAVSGPLPTTASNANDTGDTVRDLQNRVAKLEALVMAMEKERTHMRAVQEQQAADIAQLKAVLADQQALAADQHTSFQIGTVSNGKGVISSPARPSRTSMASSAPSRDDRGGGALSAATATLPTHDTGAVTETDHQASGTRNSIERSPSATQSPPDAADMLAKRLSDQTNAATAALQRIFKSAKEGNRKQTAECVRGLVAEVSAFEQVLSHAAPNRSTAKLHDAVTLLEATLLSSTDRDVMVKAYAVANEISALVP
eukprot:m.77456 g.77456  ORF g.77456 m.77456 type:complete len:741 (-) comp9138_c0_seq2:296-2518(-)